MGILNYTILYSESNISLRKGGWNSFICYNFTVSFSKTSITLLKLYHIIVCPFNSLQEDYFHNFIKWHEALTMQSTLLIHKSYIFSDFKKHLYNWAIESMGRIFLNTRLHAFGTEKTSRYDVDGLRESIGCFISLFQPLRITVPIWHKNPKVRFVNFILRLQKI